MFGGSALDPFAIFGLSRRKWWEGDNVCVERKVVKVNYFFQFFKYL
jgi:hypothetical protein